MSTLTATDRRRFRTRLRRRIFGLIVVGATVFLTWHWVQNRPRPPGDTVFRVRPYLQPGDAIIQVDRLALLWQTRDSEFPEDGKDWGVEVRVGTSGKWKPAAQPKVRRVAIEGAEPFWRFQAELTGLSPGKPFEYLVLHRGRRVFHAHSAAPAPSGTPERFVVFGDVAAGTRDQAAVAEQVYKAHPDYVMITGDIVYMRGRDSEYLARFFPIYNSDVTSGSTGAPLLRSTVFYAAPGNHDLTVRDLDKFPDGLAYFYEWSQPLNGPASSTSSTVAAVATGLDVRKSAFLEAAGSAYPRMSSFSFDRGDVHWTVIDANPYTDWTDPAAKAWLDADLAGAQSAKWRLVAMHHPPFHSSKAHREDQRMRVLAPVFEAGKVDVVFCGHVHNYQRSKPLKFVAGPPEPDAPPGKPFGPSGKLNGVWTLDTKYDGITRTNPDGVIYVVTGAGGARLYNTEQEDDPASWQTFTEKFVSGVHSLTVAEVTPGSLTIRQVSQDGKVLDQFAIHR